MANSTILTLFQNALQAMGVASSGNPATVIGNTNQDVVQTLALINIAGDALAHEFDWQKGTIQNLFTATFYQYTGTAASGATALTGMSSIANLDTTFMVVGTGIPQDTFVTSAAGTTVNINQATTAAIPAGTTFTFSKVLFTPPSDFDRLVPRTQWDKSKHWEMLGPSTPQQREWLRSGYISTGPRIRFWQMGGYFQIWPALGTTESLAYEYQSKNWVLATGAASVSKQTFTVDTDTAMYPDALMYALIKLKYWEIKGFDTTAAYRDYLMQLDLAKSQDQASATLSMAPRPSSVLIGWENIPDSNYGT